MEDFRDQALSRIEDRPQTLRIIALERMRDAILEGRIAPGERLVERQLCEQLGVSRSVVREVLRNLESEGLVETSSVHGPRLARINSSQASQIYEIRMLLESSAAAACAVLATPETFDALDRSLADIEAAHAASNPLEALRATTRFYETIFMTGGHDVAWEIVQRLNGRISRLRSMTLGVAGRSQAGLNRLRAIVQFIRSGDSDAAAAACREHVLEASKIATELLRLQEVAS